MKMVTILALRKNMINMLLTTLTEEEGRKALENKKYVKTKVSKTPSPQAQIEKVT